MRLTKELASSGGVGGWEATAPPPPHSISGWRRQYSSHAIHPPLPLCRQGPDQGTCGTRQHAMMAPQEEHLRQSLTCTDV
jgi:hypothetical protein